LLPLSPSQLLSRYRQSVYKNCRLSDGLGKCRRSPYQVSKWELCDFVKQKEKSIFSLCCEGLVTHCLMACNTRRMVLPRCPRLDGGARY
jgi:hypothetical protein